MGVAPVVDDPVTRTTEAETPPPPPPSGLVVGNYCHDVLFRDGVLIGESLGGAASFISNVFDALGYRHHCRYVAKVGPDFAYGGGNPSLPPPSVSSSSSPTTLFHAHFSSSASGDAVAYHGDRVLKRVHACDPISPSDLPEGEGDGPSFDFGLAVGVAGEISPATLASMIDLCRVVFVDVQALIRTFDPADGTVGLVPLRDTGFSHLLPRIGFLKASADEAPFVDIEEVRKSCCVVVTDGKDGCRVYWESGVLRVPPFPAVQLDPTGAGDSFLGGFAAGMVHGLTVTDAALLGNFFGSLTVSQIGVPKFHQEMLQRVKGELERRLIQRRGCRGCVDGTIALAASPGHQTPKEEEHGGLRAFLAAEAVAGRGAAPTSRTCTTQHDAVGGDDPVPRRVPVLGGVDTDPAIGDPRV